VGKVLVWDDSFQHESWNDAKTSRTTLIFDIWHPETTAKERKFLSFLGNAQLRHQKKVVEASGNEDNFFSIIDRAQYLTVCEEELWTK
jgi:aspartate beta-hydroxylase